MRITAVLEACLYADDLDAAEWFYGGVLGLDKLSSVAGRHVFFRCGSQVVLIFNPAETRKGGDVPPHGATGEGHLCFAIADSEIDAWAERLRSHGVAVEMLYTWGSRGRSLYFRDPAGNSIELATPRIWGIAEPDADYEGS